MSDTHHGEASPGGPRGPAAHRTRSQILEAADTHFRRYGYGKTTVADLARAIGVSPAYVYKFFDSKQAIGEAVCAATLEGILAVLDAVAAEDRSASERLRRLYRTLLARSLDLFFQERKLHDIVSAAVGEHWRSVGAYLEGLKAVVRRLLVEGRAAGEFERKTPIEDAASAIVTTLAPFCHPVLLEQSAEDGEDLQSSAERVASLVLRSLAP